jgi:hypothetical protein
MNEQIKKLCALADTLDKKGHYDLADDLTKVAELIVKEAMNDDAGRIAKWEEAVNKIEEGFSQGMGVMLYAAEQAPHGAAAKQAKGMARRMRSLLSAFHSKVGGKGKLQEILNMAAPAALSEPSDTTPLKEEMPEAMHSLESDESAAPAGDKVH